MFVSSQWAQVTPTSSSIESWQVLELEGATGVSDVESRLYEKCNERRIHSKDATLVEERPPAHGKGHSNP